MSSGGTQSSTTTSGPPPQVLANYSNLVNSAQGLLGQPLNQYTGSLVQGFSPDQQAGFSAVENAQGLQTPYINAAAQEFGQATTPLWQQEPQFSSSTVNQYQSPYTQDVTQSLQNLYNQQNATQQSQVAGQAASAGAYGGDRSAVAQALTAQQQQLAEAPTLAQTEQTGYQTALGEFNTEQQQELSANEANSWLGSQAGFGLASLGNQAQTGALTGASALLQTGGLQQQLGQEQLNVPYEEFESAQAYPYQQLGFLTPIVEGTGSLSGGTGTSTYPGQSALSQVAGLGLTGLGAYGLANNSGLFSGATDSGGSILSDFGGGSDAAGILSKRGGRIGHASGGRAGLADGGLAFGGPGMSGIPLLGGLGAQVPNVNLFIPQPTGASGGQSPLGLSINQPDISQTTTSSSGGGLSDLLGLASLGVKVASFFARGGRIRFDDGGTATPVPGQTDLLPQQKSATGLPSVPSISLDHIIHPGPEIKGSGPPKAPNAPSGANNQFGTAQASSLLGEMKQVGGLFGNSSSGSGLSSSSGSGSGLARGGRIGFDDGGGVPTAVAAAFGGAPPTLTGALQQLYQLPLNRLQQMAVQFPPNSQQGQMVQMAIRQKQATPGSGTAMPTSSPQTAQQQSQGAPGLGTPIPQAPAPQTGGTAAPATNPQQTNGTASAMADGGLAPGSGYVTPDELDPTPVVDHSGDTVKIKFPSENKVLDLGLPSIKRRALAAGGSSGASSGPMFSPSVTAPNGVSLPQLNTSALSIGNLAGNDPLTGEAYSPGGGSGNYFQPLPQYSPSGTGTGPGGSTQFPSTQLYTPGEAAIAAPWGITVGQSLGGAPPAAAAGSSSGSTTSYPGYPNWPSNLPAPSVFIANGIDPSTVLGGGSSNTVTGYGKRGGNVRHFDDGGDTGDGPAQTPIMQQLQEGQAYEIGQSGGLYSPPPSDKPAAPPPSAPVAAQRPLASGLAAPPPPAANIDVPEGSTGLAAPMLHGADSGEPSPPAAMATSDRGPPVKSTESAPAPTSGAGAIPLGTAISDYITQGAIQRGIDPKAALHTVATEGGTGAFQIGDSGSSGGPFQLHLEDPAHPGEGQAMGDQFYRATGKNPLDPQNERATIDYALDYAKAHGGTFDPNIWHGLRGAGNGVASGRGNAPPGADTGDQAISENLGNTALGKQYGAGLAAQPVASTDHETPQRHGLSLSDYSMPLLIAGLSTLGSRSPNALAEGFRAAAPYFTAAERAESTQQNSDVRQQANQNVAAAKAQTAGVQLEGIQQRADAALQRSNDAAARLAEATSHNQVTEQLRAETQAAQAASRDATIQLNIAKAQLTANETTGQYGDGPSDPNDPNSTKTKGTWYLPKRPDRTQPNGGAFFVPGVGAPKQATGEQAIYQDLINSGAAKDEAGAVQVYNELKRDPRTAQNSEAVARLVGQEAANLRSLPTNANASQTQLEAQARRNVFGRLGLSVTQPGSQMQGQPALANTPSPAPQPQAAPAAAQPAAPVPAPAPPAPPPHPAVIQNGWRFEWNGNTYQPVSPVQ